MNKDTDIKKLINLHKNDPLQLLSAIDGFYETVKDESGNRFTPLVGYAGKYDAGDGKELQYVGEVYANFAEAEYHPLVLWHFALQLWLKILNHFGGQEFLTKLVFVGPQMGGVCLAQMTAFHAGLVDARYACAEKKITAVASKNLREQSEMFFGRHKIHPGDKVIITEDVLNNFSTTKEVMELVHLNGGEVIAIAGLLNRSMITSDTYYFHKHEKLMLEIPIISLVNKPFDQYRQDDPYVIKDMKKGNVVLKPKAEWSTLRDAISKANMLES